VIEKAKMAGEKLLLRLQKRVQETPNLSHKRYLSQEIKRAKAQISSGAFKSVVEVDLMDFTEVEERNTEEDSLL